MWKQVSTAATGCWQWVTASGSALDRGLPSGRCSSWPGRRRERHVPVRRGSVDRGPCLNGRAHYSMTTGNSVPWSPKWTRRSRRCLVILRSREQVLGGVPRGAGGKVAMLFHRVLSSSAARCPPSAAQHAQNYQTPPRPDRPGSGGSVEPSPGRRTGSRPPRGRSPRRARGAPPRTAAGRPPPGCLRAAASCGHQG